MPAPLGHPRLRALVKWLATVLTALLIAAWLVSGKFGIVHHWTSGHSASLWRGRTHIWQSGAPIPASLAGFEWRGPTDFGLDWWMVSFKRYNQPHLAIPLWWAVLPMAAVTIALWRRDTILTRRFRMHHCMHCGYDRAGITPHAPCPECGKLPA